jgi:hypothetical protein
LVGTHWQDASATARGTGTRFGPGYFLDSEGSAWQRHAYAGACGYAFNEGAEGGKVGNHCVIWLFEKLVERTGRALLGKPAEACSRHPPEGASGSTGRDVREGAVFRRKVFGGKPF